MATVSTNALKTNEINRTRQERLIMELSHALGQTHTSDLKKLGIDVASMFGKVTVRRGKNLFDLLLNICGLTFDELQGAIRSYKQNKLDQHLIDRAGKIAQGTKQLISSGVGKLIDLIRLIQSHPREALPELLVGVLVFCAASGGPDADGGVPDLDLAMGIGAHRSIFTHSVLSGAILETGLFAIAHCMNTLHHRLPESRDPLWDEISKNSTRFLIAAATGASAGISYHLLVDGTFQHAPYHDLPVPLPMEVHQSIFIGNSLAEFLDIDKKGKTFVESADALINSAIKITKRTIGTLQASRDKNTQLIAWLLIAKHRSYVNTRWHISDKDRAELGESVAAIIHKHGCWMEALVKSEIEPITEHQIQFKMAAQGKIPPITEHERAWLAFMHGRSTN